MCWNFCSFFISISSSSLFDSEKCFAAVFFVNFILMFTFVAPVLWTITFLTKTVPKTHERTSRVLVLVGFFEIFSLIILIKLDFFVFDVFTAILTDTPRNFKF